MIKIERSRNPYKRRPKKVLTKTGKRLLNRWVYIKQRYFGGLPDSALKRSNLRTLDLKFREDIDPFILFAPKYNPKLLSIVKGNCGLFNKSGRTIYVTEKEVLSIVSAIKKRLKKKTLKGLKVYRRHYNPMIISRKPLQSRMGGGKGEISDERKVMLKPGRIFLEFFTPWLAEIWAAARFVRKKTGFDLGFCVLDKIYRERDYKEK